jgi:NADH dehydrogenase FAD-containing subunit
MKQMVKRQIKDMPKDQQDMILQLVDENPQLLKTISEEIQVKVKKGIDQQSAMMQVMMDHKEVNYVTINRLGMNTPLHLPNPTEIIPIPFHFRINLQ